ncbi:alpha/beta fold hydrolase [Sphingomonas sp. M1-B02]|uniref:alpha/beta fold hydrolase n=1 Tax=Sphingomonas sp. M1-B02 TaxID=3114300 RepID=UPI0022400967|nr:alpha/beta fold hydrolase [Sphingomonas sp. S6-11]UZK67167.1 alpha/beta hydrolase [Sphingomonas sp. S6-11]
MASFPTETHHFTSFDGVDLAWHEVGTGRPVVLIHGYFSNAFINWIRYGHAAMLAERGFRLILPDLRAHGESAKPHDPAAYPPDALMRDGMALIAHLGLTDYDLGGYSLGARTVVRMLANGAAPRRVVLAGMGLTGLEKTGGRGEYFRRVLTNLGSFERGSTEWMTEAFLKTTKGDPEALLLILETFVDTPVEAIGAIVQPTVVISGAEDFDNGSAEEIADLLPRGSFVEIPGNHMSAVSRPELGQAIAEFLGG